MRAMGLVSLIPHPSLYTTPSGARDLNFLMSSGPDGAAATTTCSREERVEGETESWLARKETRGGAR